MRRWKYAFLTTLVLALSFIPQVYAVDENDKVNLLDLPKKIAEALGIPEFAGGILACSFVLFIVLLPIAIYGKGNFLLSLFVGFIVLGFCVAVGWLPFWFLLVIVLVTAVLFSGKIKEWIT